MPRKSSFLSGFEVGSALYSRGYQQAAQQRQMQLDEKRHTQAEKRSQLDFNLRKDLAEQSRLRFEAEVEAKKRTNAIAATKAKDLRESSEVINDLLENFGPEGMALDFNNPEDVTIAQPYILAAYGRIKDPTVSKRLDNWVAQHEKSVGNQILKTINLNNAATTQQIALANLKSQAALEKDIKAFEARYDISFPANPEGRAKLTEWKRKMEDARNLAELGKMELGKFADFAGVEVFREELQSIIDLRDVKRDVAAADAAEQVVIEAETEEKKATARNLSAIALASAEKVLKGDVKGKFTEGDQKIILDQSRLIMRNKQVVEAVSTHAQYLKMEKILGHTTVTAADDLAMIFMFMKSLDPPSTVREGEAASAQNSTGVPGRIRNAYNNLLAGTRLDPTQRKNFLATAYSATEGAREKAREVVASYEEGLTNLGVAPYKYDEIRKLIGYSITAYPTKTALDQALQSGALKAGDRYTYIDGGGAVQGGTVQGPADDETSQAPTWADNIDSRNFETEQAQLEVMPDAYKTKMQSRIGESLEFTDINQNWKWFSESFAADPAHQFEIMEAGKDGFKVRNTTTGTIMYLPANMLRDE